MKVRKNAVVKFIFLCLRSSNFRAIDWNETKLEQCDYCDTKIWILVRFFTFDDFKLWNFRIFRKKCEISHFSVARDFLMRNTVSWPKDQTKCTRHPWNKWLQTFSMLCVHNLAMFFAMELFFAILAKKCENRFKIHKSWTCLVFDYKVEQFIGSHTMQLYFPFIKLNRFLLGLWPTWMRNYSARCSLVLKK